MKMRHLLLIVLSLGLILSLTSCNLAYWFEEIPTDDEQLHLDQLSVNGENIGTYTIVYQESQTDVKRWSNYYYGADYDYGLVCAQTLQQTIAEICGKTLPISAAFDPEDHGRVILVGFACGPYLKNPLAYDEMLFSVCGDSILLCGGSDAANYQSISLFVRELKMLSGSKSMASLEDGFEVTEKCDVERIACLGDSLTFGVGADQPKYLSYPAVLGRLCWKFAVVNSFALPGACVLPDSDFSLVSSGAYEECLENVGEFDYVILLIGTYDSHHVFESGKTWNFTNDSDFLVAYLDAAERLLEKNGNCTLFVLNSPAVSPTASEQGYGTDDVRLLQKKAYDTLLAKDYNVHFVDLFFATADRMTQYLRSDGVTYTNAGYFGIADQICYELVQYMNNLEDENSPST